MTPGVCTQLAADHKRAGDKLAGRGIPPPWMESPDRGRWKPESHAIGLDPLPRRPRLIVRDKALAGHQHPVPLGASGRWRVETRRDSALHARHTYHRSRVSRRKARRRPSELGSRCGSLAGELRAFAWRIYAVDLSAGKSRWPSHWQFRPEMARRSPGSLTKRSGRLGAHEARSCRNTQGIREARRE